MSWSISNCFVSTVVCLQYIIVVLCGACRDITCSLDPLRKWNAARKLKNTALAVKSVIRFQLAGARHRSALLAAARHAKRLEKEGISWRLTCDDIEVLKSPTAARQQNYADTENFHNVTEEDEKDGSDERFETPVVRNAWAGSIKAS